MRDYLSGDCTVRNQQTGSVRYVNIYALSLDSRDVRVTNYFEARYRILEALIQQGPCTTHEVENTIRVGDGTDMSAFPILQDLLDSCVEYDDDTQKWKIIGTNYPE